MRTAQVLVASALILAGCVGSGEQERDTHSAYVTVERTTDTPSFELDSAAPRVLVEAIDRAHAAGVAIVELDREQYRTTDGYLRARWAAEEAGPMYQPVVVATSGGAYAITLATA